MKYVRYICIWRIHAAGALWAVIDLVCNLALYLHCGRAK